MKKERIFALDFVRTAAMMIIIMFHWNQSVNVRGVSPINFLQNDFGRLNLAYVGVPMFFVLSGFALMYTSKDGVSPLEFYKKRFKAILPMYWIAWILVSVYYLVVYHSICPFGERPSKKTLILTILGFDGYLTPVVNNYYRIGEWFLGCIIIIYLIFPILRWGIKKYPKLIWIPFIALYVYLIFNYTSAIPQPQNAFVRLPEFMIGIYLCEFRDKIDWKAAIAAAIGIVLLVTTPLDSPFPLMFMVTLMGLCCFVLAYWIGSLIKNKGVQKPFSWFSKYSFAVYLLHHVISEQIIEGFRGYFLTTGEAILLFAYVLAVDIILGYLLFRLTNIVMKKFTEWARELFVEKIR